MSCPPDELRSESQFGLQEADNTSAFHSGQWSMEDIAMISFKANDIRKLPAKPRRMAKTVKPSFLHHPANHSFSQKGKV
jgi:hypothetical protein